MLRRHMLSVVGVLALGGLLGAQSSGQADSAKSKTAPCVCCGDACACKVCGCGDCCGVKAEKACCLTKVSEPSTGQAVVTSCPCCGDACTCSACGCGDCC